MKNISKVAKIISENIHDFICEGREFDIIVEYTIKGESISTPKVISVDSGYSYLIDKGYSEIGFKCFQKDGRVNRKIAYLFFESSRISSALGSLTLDFENIQKDVSQKV